MKTINMIMAAIDFSQYALPVAQYAGGLAKDTGARLLLVNVLNQRDVDMMNKIEDQYPDFPKKRYLEEKLNDCQAKLKDMVKAIDQGTLDVRTHVCIGIPYEALMEVIDAKKPDLLVMGTKGRSNLVDTIVGSCAQKMFRRSPIPLLSLRAK